MFCIKCGRQIESGQLCGECETLQKEVPVRFGVGIKIWVIVVIILNLIFLVVNLSMGLSVMAVCGLGYIAAHIWLLVSRSRLAFLAIVGLSVIMILINMFVYDLGVMALSGIVNPLITYAFLYRSWPQMH